MKSEWVNWSMPLYITWIKCSRGNDLCKVRALVVSTRSPTWSQTWQNINRLILHSFQLSMPNASYYYIWLVIWVEVSVSLWKTPSNYILNTKTNQPFLRFHSTWNNVKLPSKPQEKLLLHCKGRQTPVVHARLLYQDNSVLKMFQLPTQIFKAKGWRNCALMLDLKTKMKKQSFDVQYYMSQRCFSYSKYKIEKKFWMNQNLFKFLI